jgi:transcriptional repressor NrdR
LEKRPVDTESVDAAISHIKHRLQSCGEREIPSRQLGEWVMEELRSLDQVAYVRFASVYRSFQDVSEFRDEIERLEKGPTPEEQRNQMPLLPGDEEDS